jgi:hypothetical protein
MKSKEDIKKEIDRLKKDDRLKGKPALVEINAPLALIQVHLESRIAALEWVLDGK